jgi:hypothetical protein
MLYRESAEGRIAITQPMHAWVSGQLARAWGNQQFGEVRPREAVCLAAEQHDIGHIPWEQMPRLNERTGLPYSFYEMPRQWHVQLWSVAARMVLPQGRYAALLVSLHGTVLYESYDPAKDTPENAQTVEAYLTQERAFQQELITSLRSDAFYAPYATDEMIVHNRRLIQLWDALSLYICFARQQAQIIQQVPTAIIPTTLTITPRNDEATQFTVTPWPFSANEVILTYEGRYLNETFSDEAVMRETLQRAPWVTLETRLLPV